MLLNEIINEVGMTKRAVKYYEEKGLLSVDKDNNGYRNYTAQDVETLKKISVYRKLGISIKDIQSLLETGDKSILLRIYQEKVQEKVLKDSELEALKQFIDDGDADKANEALDYQTVENAIESLLPGKEWGDYFKSHFKPFLNVRLKTLEQKQALQNILEYCDETTLKVPFIMGIGAKMIGGIAQETRTADEMIAYYRDMSESEYERLKEKVWKSGGLYSAAIDRIIFWLEKAADVAENGKQAEVLHKLIEFYRTGDLKTFDEYTILWVQETEAMVDFTNGFTETYGDPLGLKASWEGYANFKDLEATARTEKLSANAQWFEDHSPVDDRFKKAECRGVSAKVIKAAILGGDLYPASAIGINLPNSNWVRAEYGSKSVTIGNLTDAYNKAAHGNGFLQEFVIDDETLRLLDRYQDTCDDLHTDLHECLGHGSGKLLPGVDPDALKAYGAAIEEARADLFGLYYLADTKLVELGLTPDAEAYKAQYYGYMMNGLLTQTVRIEPGRDIEEAHMRNRALIARWTYEHGREEEVAELVKRDGKTYVRIRDYEKLRELFGLLLSEIQRIKSEGDYEAARDLVKRYGVKIDPDLHTEILQRYRALHLSPYKGFINPVYTPVYNEQKEITDIKVEYGEAYDAQMLRYSRDYATLPYCNE